MSMIFLAIPKRKRVEVLIGYRSDEVTPEELDGYRMREAIKRRIPVDRIVTVEETTEDFIGLRTSAAGR